MTELEGAMSRRRRDESQAHRRERQRRRLRAAAYRAARQIARRAMVQRLYARVRSHRVPASFLNASLMPRAWLRRLQKGLPL